MAAVSTKRKGIVQAHPLAVEWLKAQSKGGAHIAHGFKANPAQNMKYFGGRTLPDLSFKHFYLGHWAQSDITAIDGGLSGAMTDPNLNHVMQQYFTGGPMTTHFLGSTVRGDSSLTAGVTFDRDSVHTTLAALDLSGIDLTTTVICLFLPQGVILDTTAKGGVGNVKGPDDDKDTSLEGLGGYHGSASIAGNTVYFAVGVYSEQTAAGINGIPFWPDSWKNIVATFYHELNEARTDPDVEDVNRTGDQKKLGWYSDTAGEIGDIPMSDAGAHLGLVMVEVALIAGGTVPIQLMWSNQVSGPCGPF
jgi:hypothetical protein